jgi:hypothetical protein
MSKQMNNLVEKEETIKLKVKSKILERILK